MQTIVNCKYKITGSFLIFLVLFTSFGAVAQLVSRANNARALQRFAPSASSIVKVQTVKDGSVLHSYSAAIQNVTVPAGNKTVISYENKIATIDKESYSKLASTPMASYKQEDIKMLPELHVENVNANDQLIYRIVFSEEQPLHYDYTLKKFNARLGFFLLGESVNNDVTIKEPVNIEVVSTDVASIDPDRLQISHLNLPSTSISVSAEQISDSTSVKVITTSNPAGYTAYLKVKPTLEISTNRTSMEGLGIQKIPVSIRFIGSNSSDSVKVNVSTTKGMIKPDPLYVSYNKPAIFYLRSEGLGDIVISAASNNLQSNSLTLKYVFPWLFLLASIGGGLLGSFTKYYMNQETKKFSMKPIIGGTLLGFLGAVVYYALGINLIGFDLTADLNEFAVLGFSALCAYFGFRV